MEDEKNLNTEAADCSSPPLSADAFAGVLWAGGRTHLLRTYGGPELQVCTVPFSSVI